MGKVRDVQESAKSKIKVGMMVIHLYSFTQLYSNAAVEIQMK